MTNLEWLRTLSEEELAAGYCEATELGSTYPWCRRVPATECVRTACDRCMVSWLQDAHRDHDDRLPWEEEGQFSEDRG